MCSNVDCLNDDAIDFVLHNCYTDKEGEPLPLESEVGLHAFESYRMYQFFRKHKCYKQYYKWTSGHQGQPNCEEIKFQGKFYPFDDFPTIENKRFTISNIGSRRQSECKGYFFCKDSLNNESIEKSKHIDLSADVITSIKTPLNNLLDYLELKKATNEDIKQLQILEFYNVSLAILEKINSKVDKNLANDLIEAFKNFCCTVGTIGNMMPIPEHTNPGGKDCDNYYYKFKHLYMNLFDSQTMDISGQKSVVRFFWLFYEKNHIYNQTEESRIKYIEDFCLQDYFADNNKDYEEIISPCENMDDNDKGYPSNVDNIRDWVNDWVNWLNCNTCLILKRGARIYAEGCGEKDNEKKNKARKELAIELISDKRFNNEKFKDEKFSLAKWYENNQEGFRLEKLFN